MHSEQRQGAPFPDNVDLREGFRAMHRHLTALSVPPESKQDSRPIEPELAEDRPDAGCARGPRGQELSRGVSGRQLLVEGR